jgi:hypothetical protein
MSYQDPNSIVEKLHAGHPIDPVHPDSHVMCKSKYPVVESNKYYLALNALTFGSTSSLQIPNAGVVKQVFINGYFGTDGSTSKTCANAGYAMISNIQYRIGNSTLYTIDGVDNWNINCSQLRTQEAIQEAYLLAGGDADGSALTVPKEFSVAIATPYSRFMLMARQYGIDTTIMKTPLQIFVTLKASSAVYSAGAQSALSSASFHIIQSEYMDRSNRMVPHDGQFLSLPTRYFQSYTTRPFTPGSTTQSQTVDLLSFRKGNLIGMIICGIDSSNYSGLTPFSYNSISNLQISFNGVNVYVSLNNDYKLQQLRNSVGSYSYHISPSGTRNYRVEPCFVPFHWGQAGMNFNYGLQLNAQTLQASFTSSSTNAQILHITYVYDAIVLYNEEQQDIVL